MQNNDLLVPNNKYILLIDNRAEKKLVRICEHKNYKWRKMPIDLTQIAKYQFYQQLQVGNHSLTPIETQFLQQGVEEEQECQQQCNNNREIYEIEEAQKLQQEDISRMKKQMNGKQIISELVDHNQQFSKRTGYSKEKYLKKKQRKYLFRIHAEPATIDNVHGYYFKNQPKFVGFIRWDMLGLMLLHAGPFKHTLIGQKTKGILLGSLLIRQPSSITFAGEQKKNVRNYSIVEQLNIAREQQQSVVFTTWKQLVQENKVHRFDNLLLLGNYDFSGIISAVDPLLKSGCLVTFFCLSIQPILEAHSKMQNLGYYNIHVYDSWAREYQVLKNRTHPMMYMDSCSGYLLVGIKID